jgi:hypothetical protein
MQLLERHGLTHLLGEIAAAEIIDVIENPALAADLAELANSDRGKRLRRMRARNRAVRFRKGGEIVDV